MAWLRCRAPSREGNADACGCSTWRCSRPLIGSAAWAYSIKYETIYFAQKLERLDENIEKQREEIAILRADWQHLSQPMRIQMLAERHLQVATLKAIDIVSPTDIPSRDLGEDLIGRKT